MLSVSLSGEEISPLAGRVFTHHITIVQFIVITKGIERVAGSSLMLLASAMGCQ